MPEHEARATDLEPDADGSCTALLRSERVAEPGQLQEPGVDAAIGRFGRFDLALLLAAPPAVVEDPRPRGRLSGAEQSVSRRGACRRGRMHADTPVGLLEEPCETARQRRAFALERPLRKLIDDEQ